MHNFSPGCYPELYICMHQKYIRPLLYNISRFLFQFFFCNFLIIGFSPNSFFHFICSNLPVQIQFPGFLQGQILIFSSTHFEMTNWCYTLRCFNLQKLSNKTQNFRMEQWRRKNWVQRDVLVRASTWSHWREAHSAKPMWSTWKIHSCIVRFLYCEHI